MTKDPKVLQTTRLSDAEIRELQWANQHWREYIATIPGGKPLQEAQTELADYRIAWRELRELAAEMAENKETAEFASRLSDILDISRNVKRI